MNGTKPRSRILSKRERIRKAVQFRLISINIKNTKNNPFIFTNPKITLFYR